MATITSDDTAPAFAQGATVKPRGKGKSGLEMTVAWHQGGTVHCEWWDAGEKKEANYSAFELELVKAVS